MALQIHHVAAFSDNYIWILRDDMAGQTAVIDPGDAAPVLAFLNKKNWRLDWILNTHHHWDHVNGNAELKAKTGCRVVTSFHDKNRIPAADMALHDGDVFTFGNHAATVLFTPGHTKGHISFWFAQDRALFCGDTLFLMGCGRLLEGDDAPTLYASLMRLAKLPPETKIYCTHEYTLSNARFARTVDPQNAMLLTRYKEVEKMRAQDMPTVPALLAEELATNPFLRVDMLEIRRVLGMPNAKVVEVFEGLRRRKDRF